MIIRVWSGWTLPGQAEAYQQLLNESIAPAILHRGISGLRELAVMRRVQTELDSGDEAQFLTLMTFDNWTAVTEFAGPDPAASVVPAAARALLSRYDNRSQHYELIRRHSEGHAGV